MARWRALDVKGYRALKTYVPETAMVHRWRERMHMKPKWSTAGVKERIHLKPQWSTAGVQGRCA